jgi:7-cyano-7-deazaguanine synthase
VKVVVLFSGGLDSTVLVADRIYYGDEVVPVSFDYGQTHRGRELAAAKRITQHYRLRHRVVGLTSALLPSALTGTVSIPETHATQPDATTVPGRNMILLSVGVAIAEAEAADQVLFGANADDVSGYLDCRPGFVAAFAEAARVSTASQVEVLAPFQYLTKQEIVEHGRRLGAPLEMSWSCYRGGESPCLRCGACESREAAFV